jgi:hypothetical protein
MKPFWLEKEEWARRQYYHNRKTGGLMHVTLYNFPYTILREIRVNL